ncbi:MAG: hypothetical protein H0X24_11785 [Ktedonobacterales bacterium]|nr:hypothetical protein [Ktedonobacterales bacterium]
MMPSWLNCSAKSHALALIGAWTVRPPVDGNRTAYFTLTRKATEEATPDEIEWSEPLNLRPSRASRLALLRFFIANKTGITLQPEERDYDA